MEQSVAVSSSHIVRQGTFATDSSKTLRSKSGAIKKGSISLPIVDDVGKSRVESEELVGIVKKRKKNSEKPPVRTTNDQSESKRDVISPNEGKSKSKDTVHAKQENLHQSSKHNSTEREVQSKSSLNKSSKESSSTTSPKQSNAGKSDVVIDKQERRNSVKHSRKDTKENESVNERVQNSVVFKPNSKVKEAVNVHGSNNQDKQKESVSNDENRTSKNTSEEINTSVGNVKSVRKHKSDRKTVTTQPLEETGIKVIGHIEASSDSRSSHSLGKTSKPQTEAVNSENSNVKSEKRESKEKGSKKQKYAVVDGDDKSLDVNVKNQGVKTESVNTVSTTQKGEPKKKRFTKASDIHEDPTDTHVRKLDSPDPKQIKEEREIPKNKFPEGKSQTRDATDKTGKKPAEIRSVDKELYTRNNSNLNSVSASDSVVNKPPQSTTLVTKHGESVSNIERDSALDKYRSDPQNPHGDFVAPVKHKSKDSTTKMAMEYDAKTVKESYDSVFEERKTLLAAEVTYKKRISQLEDEMNQFVRTVEDLRTENQTIRTTMERMENEQKKQDSHQSKNTVVIIADEETSEKSPSSKGQNTAVDDAEKDDLKKQIEILKQEKKSLDDKVRDLNGKNKDLESRNTSLDREVASLRDRLRDLEKQSSGKSEERSIAEKQDNSDNDIKNTAETKEQHTVELLPDLQSKSKNELKSEKDADDTSTGTDKMALKLHVVSLQTDNQKLNEENIKLKAECFNQAKKIHELEKAERTEVEKWKAENEELKQQMKKLQEEKGGGSGDDTKKLEAENKALSEALSQKKMELDELMHALNGDRIEDEVQKIKTEKEKLQKQLQESQKKVESTEKVVQELEDIKSEKVNLQQKLEISEKKVVENDQQSDEIKELKSEKEKLQKQLEENEKRVLESASSHVIIHELKSDKEKLEKQLEETKKRESNIEKSFTEMKIQKDALETEKNKIKEELEESVKINKNIQAETEKLKSSQETMSRTLDEEKAKLTLQAEKEWQYDELKKKFDLLEKELARTKQLHSDEVDKITDEKRKEENKLRKELENATERKNETIEKLTKRLLSMESTKNLEIKTLKEQIESLVVDKEIVEKTKETDKENKELRQELKTVYNKYSELVTDFEQKKNTEERAFEMSMRVEKMSVKMKLMEKDEREWRVKKERFEEIEASNKRLMEESITLRKMLEEKSKGPSDMSHRIEFLERRQTDSDTRVKQLEGWVGDLYIDTDRTAKGRNKNAAKNKTKQNSKPLPIPAKMSTLNTKTRSLDDVEVQVDDKATESSTPTLPSIYANSTGQLTFRRMGYSDLHKARVQASKKRR
ncbi:putative leucine-rich repeat-containing protein DDB_G0290503 [Argopecten irradians]|uniref:putative leucine-rich repeat-containing protein DDB_G0290503 n=1 Tax=Argopecten irradians TaxID=31199 RepID=UPI0037216695